MEGRASAFPAFDADRASVRIHHVFDDLRAQSGSTRFAADRPRGEQTIADFRDRNGRRKGCGIAPIEYSDMIRWFVLKKSRVQRRIRRRSRARSGITEQW